MKKNDLTGKVAWVTGSSRGIGRVIAAHLASLGARVAIHGTGPHSTRAFGEGDSLQAVADEVAAEAAAQGGGEILAVHGDLTDEAVVKRLAQQIRTEFGEIDILVNCAGGDIGAQGTMGENAGKPLANDAVEVAVADIRAVLDRNLLTCILVSREVAPEMMARKSGKIVNIGSVAGLKGGTNGAIYATAKAAVHEYARCLADQLRPYNVNVNTIAPGSIVTARFSASRPIDERMAITEGTLVRYGWPQEIAEAVGFLVSAESDYISGQVLRVDGGEQLWPA